MHRGATAPERAKAMTLEEWAALDEEVEGELVDGRLEEEELPTFLHELVVMWLAAVLRVWARRRRAFVVGSDTKIAIGPRRGRKPDLSVFLAGALPALPDALVRVPPHLVAEVASARPRDVRRDRVDKRADYARAGIRLYVLVDPQLRSAEVYELGRDGRYAVAGAAGRGRLRVPGCPGLVLDLDALWREVDEAERAHARTARRRRRS
jgi:Uma2 family endonuclease